MKSSPELFRFIQSFFIDGNAICAEGYCTFQNPIVNAGVATVNIRNSGEGERRYTSTNFLF